MAMSEQILIADDAVAFAHRVQALLSRRTFVVHTAHTVTETFDRIASSGPFDLFVLGQTVGGVPGRSLWDALKTTYRIGKASVLLSAYQVGAQGDETWREIEQARQLADAIQELLGHPTVAAPYPLRCGPLIINRENHEVRVQEKLLNLTPKEIEVLYHLAQHAGELVTRDDLMASVWADDKTVKSQIVDVYLKRLRAVCGGATNMLSFRTVFKMGYQLRIDRRWMRK
jgi:two-component system alkaline phosphatase synthesis response regulator PhoP